jgi:hypothetical protein
MSQAWPRSICGVVGLVALVPAAAASAASQGSLGAPSRGSLTISITIRAPTRVSGLSDLAFDGAGATAGTAREVCLSGVPHSYTVAARGTGPGGALALSNGDANVPYRVEWLARDGSGRADALSGDAPVTIRAVADPADCARGSGAGRLRIALDSSDSARLQAGAPYAGALLLMLAPE